MDTIILHYKSPSHLEVGHRGYTIYFPHMLNEGNTQIAKAGKKKKKLAPAIVHSITALICSTWQNVFVFIV